MLASVLTKGTTTIVNAAMEPEIVDLQNFLKELRCKSIGLAPISHPPVCDSLWVHKF